MKKSILTVLSLSLSAILFSQNLSTDLLLHYPFDGNANDVSVNQFHGISNASLSPDRFGNANSAYYFNGIDQYIDLPVSPILKPQLPISYSFWVKFDVIDASKTVIATNDFATDSHSGTWINTSGSGNFAANYGDNTGGTSTPNRRTKVGATSLQAGVWYHLVAIIRGPQDMELYIDCREDEGTYSGSGGMIAYSSAPGSIGRKDSNTAGPAHYFQGSIDDFRYWSRALTHEEVSLLCKWDLDIEENELHSDLAFKVFPNPANNQITIETTNLETVHKYRILSVEGKEVLIGEIDKSIDVSGLSDGIYTISLFDKNDVLLGTKKIVIH